MLVERRPPPVLVSVEAAVVAVVLAVVPRPLLHAAYRQNTTPSTPNMKSLVSPKSTSKTAAQPQLALLQLPTMLPHISLLTARRRAHTT
ncbi:hypothetical protein K438DRAFT_1846212 [Mycena galopus ATCC 62051]|nr:hypothetical protein K438DRAFT_1846212 [Mycena galopus ATCC 62051]